MKMGAAPEKLGPLLAYIPARYADLDRIALPSLPPTSKAPAPARCNVLLTTRSFGERYARSDYFLHLFNSDFSKNFFIYGIDSIF